MTIKGALTAGAAVIAALEILAVLLAAFVPQRTPSTEEILHSMRTKYEVEVTYHIKGEGRDSVISAVIPTLIVCSLHGWKMLFEVVRGRRPYGLRESAKYRREYSRNKEAAQRISRVEPGVPRSSPNVQPQGVPLREPSHPGNPRVPKE